MHRGHDLAIHICAIFHVAAPDQPYQPIMKAFGTLIFASIVRQKTFDAESLTHFMTTTHRGLDNPQGMPLCSGVPGWVATEKAPGGSRGSVIFDCARQGNPFTSP
jgi:hypothetical protein